MNRYRIHSRNNRRASGRLRRFDRGGQPGETAVQHRKENATDPSRALFGGRPHPRAQVGVSPRRETSRPASTHA